MNSYHGILRNIGKPLTTDLVQKGHTVTVISSKPERQSEIKALAAKAATSNRIHINENTDFPITELSKELKLL
jgi:3-hydroxyisobutyrate dehydrogenase-like beta-hydroxyacid dehydrogenase